MKTIRRFLIPEIVLCIESDGAGKFEVQMTWQQAVKNHHTTASELLASMAAELDAAQLQAQQLER